MSPNILCIETSGFFPSVAVVTPTQKFSLTETKERYQHNAVIHQMVDKILSQANITFTHLEAVAVNEGPGSYTGLRVGVSCAKTYAYALNIPLIALSSLHIQAADLSVLKEKKNILSTLVARKQEIFVTELDATLKERKKCALVFFDTHPLPPAYFEDKVIVGDGIPILKNLGLTQKSTLLEQPMITANNMVSLAQEKFKKQLFEDILSFVPNYQKDFMAYP